MDYELIYKGFYSPIARIDCGSKCAPYNEKAVPFCCDTRHAVPTAYDAEWDYLQSNTDLWHLWEVGDEKEYARLRSKTPAQHMLIECKGHLYCQRQFRSLTCRSFPFFPYFDKTGNFLGLSYYWEYEERCWVISHLDQISPVYVKEFIQTYHLIFECKPEERDSFLYHSAVMRRIFGRKHRAIPLIDFQGQFYKITPHNGRKRRIQAEQLPKFGPNRVAALLPFPDEIP
jgi:hypothetical protein